MARTNRLKFPGGASFCYVFRPLRRYSFYLKRFPGQCDNHVALNTGHNGDRGSARYLPLVLLVPEILASNYGGTATLIGDPPNIMIGSYAGLTFNDFVINLTPVVIAVMVAQIIYNKMIYGGHTIRARVEDVAKMISLLQGKI